MNEPGIKITVEAESIISESFHLFRAEQHKFYIYRQCTNIVFILQ
jgi:hypothetical protein